MTHEEESLNNIMEYVLRWNGIQQEKYDELETELNGKGDGSISKWKLPMSLIEIPKGWRLKKEDFKKIDNMEVHISSEECEYYEVDDYMNVEPNIGEVEEELVHHLMDKLEFSKDSKSYLLRNSYENRHNYMDKKEVKEQLEKSL